MQGPHGLTSYSLTGTLEDGTVLDRLVESIGGGSFHLNETSYRLEWSGVLPPITADGSSDLERLVAATGYKER
jgi:hypothetical protein